MKPFSVRALATLAVSGTALASCQSQAPKPPDGPSDTEEAASPEAVVANGAVVITTPDATDDNAASEVPAGQWHTPAASYPSRPRLSQPPEGPVVPPPPPPPPKPKR